MAITKKFILPVLICLFPAIIHCQSPDSAKLKPVDEEQLVFLTNLVELYDKGFELSDDSLRISKEVRKLLEDEDYRAKLYPKPYSWDEATAFMKKQELKKAFWFFINLYPVNDLNKKLVIESVVTYDQLFKMDEIMMNTFYTYSFMDPEVSVIQDGKPEIVRPDILEAKLRTVREIVGYIVAYREQKQKEATGE